MELTTTQLIVGAVLGSTGIVGGILTFAKFLLDRNDKKHDERQKQIDQHVTDAAQIRKLDDERANQLYDKMEARAKRAEDDADKCRRRIDRRDKVIRAAIRQLRSTKEQCTKVIACVAVGMLLEDLKIQADFLHNDLERVEVILTEEDD